MTIFIYEHLTSGALADESFSSGLMREGDAMLQAISADLIALGHDICLLRDARLPAPAIASARLSLIQVDSLTDYQKCWQRSLARYDLFLIIAPETGGILLKLVSQLEQLGKTHLGCSADSIAQCTDKYITGQQLKAAGLLTPNTLTADAWLSEHDESGNCLIKPRDGAGCEQTFRLSAEQAQVYLSELDATRRETLIVQPFIEGDAISLSLFISDRDISVLSVNRQVISDNNGQLRLDSCHAGQSGCLAAELASDLARQIHDTMPGLWGFVGIDLIKAGEELWVIDINPRLTSSYAEPELRNQCNPALALHQSLLS